MHTKPFQVVVPTYCTAHTTRHPVPEGIFDGTRTQPYLHDCLIRVHEGSHTYQFRIFFKRHCFLPVNKSVRCGSQGHVFRGDALVMRVGARDRHSVVNMRERDTILSDYVIIK
jgi:hypothetical protein